MVWYWLTLWHCDGKRQVHNSIELQPQRTTTTKCSRIFRERFWVTWKLRMHWKCLQFVESLWRKFSNFGSRTKRTIFVKWRVFMDMCTRLTRNTINSNATFGLSWASSPSSQRLPCCTSHGHGRPKHRRQLSSKAQTIRPITYPFPQSLSVAWIKSRRRAPWKKRAKCKISTDFWELV